jgi:hypothetical protein
MSRSLSKYSSKLPLIHPLQRQVRSLPASSCASLANGGFAEKLFIASLLFDGSEIIQNRFVENLHDPKSVHGNPTQFSRCKFAHLCLRDEVTQAQQKIFQNPTVGKKRPPYFYPSYGRQLIDS